MTKITRNMIQTSKITEEISNIMEAESSLITEVVKPLQWPLFLDKLQFKIQLLCKLPGQSNIKVECIIQ